MVDESEDKLKEDLSTIDPAEFKWNETNMSTGFIAQDVNSVCQDTITLSSESTDLSDISLGIMNIPGASVMMAGSSGSSPMWSTYTTSPSLSIQPSISIGEDNGKTYIKTRHHEIDIDELGDLMKTLKERLLVLTPNFEKHEKYPMLKQMYDEYKAMERLLSGPDSE
jgi:hypothetical protein